MNFSSEYSKRVHAKLHQTQRRLLVEPGRHIHYTHSVPPGRRVAAHSGFLQKRVFQKIDAGQRGGLAGISSGVRVCFMTLYSSTAAAAASELSRERDVKTKLFGICSGKRGGEARMGIWMDT